MEENYKSLGEVSKGFELNILIPDNLWVTWHEVDGWREFAFWEFREQVYGDENALNIKVECLFRGEGPSSNLRECRHTYWGDDGYIHFPDFTNIITALSWLRTFYDGN